MHLTLPVWLRLLVVVLADNGVYPLSFVVLPAVTVLIIPAFYSMFLPYLVSHVTAGVDGNAPAEQKKSPLPFLYAIELFGAVCGIAVLVTAGGMGVQAVLLIYAPVLLVMVHLVQPRFRYYIPAMLALAVLSAGWIVAFPAANTWSNTLWYIRVKGLPEGTETLMTAYSPYQKVDMMEAPGGRRYMFLDGLEHFGSDETLWLSVIMGRIPAQMIQPEKGLAVGAGGMNTARMMADYGNTAVTTVEIDPVVVDASVNFLSDSNGMDTLRNRTIIIDDAKHFFANTSEYYDMVAADTPAALSLQTAALYSVPFYELIEARLNPGGVLSANLTDTFERDNPDTPEAEGLVARRITASLLAVYDEVIVVTSGNAGWSFAYAADDLPFTAEDVEMALRGAGEKQFVLYDIPAVKAIVDDATPITLDTMDIVLQTGADWLKDRLAWR
jgi:spermidine synthase